MFKEIVKSAVAVGKAKFQQKTMPVTNDRLLDFGFIREDNNFKMGDLTIYLIEGYHFYINKEQKYTRIKNCYTVAQLVYGEISYGK